ncbi:hypothetical protein XENOCAPTIV_017257 [Xenoophorus captivus]|uniref:Uncharacterized protein n=1 Tax=Xenoophorus captivus TaxID=1517983 RepID=A0ABV0QES1_9TELE
MQINDSFSAAPETQILRLKGMSDKRGAASLVADNRIREKLEKLLTLMVSMSIWGFLSMRSTLMKHHGLSWDCERSLYHSLDDTAGQERFHALGPIYYRDSNGAILVYDITDEDSFQKVKEKLSVCCVAAGVMAAAALASWEDVFQCFNWIKLWPSCVRTRLNMQFGNVIQLVDEGAAVS